MLNVRIACIAMVCALSSRAEAATYEVDVNWKGPQGCLRPSKPFKQGLLCPEVRKQSIDFRVSPSPRRAAALSFRRDL